MTAVIFSRRGHDGASSTRRYFLTQSQVLDLTDVGQFHPELSRFAGFGFSTVQSRRP